MCQRFQKRVGHIKQVIRKKRDNFKRHKRGLFFKTEALTWHKRLFQKLLLCWLDCCTPSPLSGQRTLKKTTTKKHIKSTDQL